MFARGVDEDQENRLGREHRHDREPVAMLEHRGEQIAAVQWRRQIRRPGQ